MSSRFGAAAPSRKNTKLKMLLGSMVFLLLIVLLVLVWVLQNSTPGATSQLPEVQTPIQVQQDAGNVGILVPLFRIEKGQKLSEEMFKTNFVPESQVPMGSMLAASKSSFSEREKYAARLINPNVALMKEDIADNPPIDQIDIPPGYRLITILVDSQSGVDGWAKPGTRVDINWTFMQDGKKKIASPLVRFVKVISVGIDTGNEKDQRSVIGDKKVTLSMLVTERQSQFIEVAKGNGELSLVLVGGAEAPPNVDDPPIILEYKDIIGDNRPAGPEPEPTYDGVMYSTDPVTGKKTKYLLQNGRWNIDKTYSE